MKTSAAISAIEKHGMLLVYPISGEKDPPSLWSAFYPRSRMRWEWDENGDDRVARLWHLREELSRSKKVVYAKWLKGRATFFSRACFRSILALSLARQPALSRDSRAILSLLEESSPRSTKELKKETGLQGKLLDSTFQRAMKELWVNLLIVGFGEIDDGAFPSLAVGATRLIFEDLYQEARELSAEEAKAALESLLGRSPAAQKFLTRAIPVAR